MARRSSFALLLLVATVDLVAAEIAATLTLDSAVTITPVPVSFKFTFLNLNSEEREVPRKAVLIVTPAGGDPFIVRWRGYYVADLGLASGIAPVKVPPRSSTEFELPANVFFNAPEWFTDPRLYAAGKKELQVVFSDALDDGREVTPATVRELPDRVVTTKAALEIKPAVGEDAAVCEFVRDHLQKDEPCPLHAMGEPALIAQVWEKFPKSSYRDYLVSRMPDMDPAVRIARVEEAVARGKGLALWWNLLTLARWYDIEMGNAVSQRDSARARVFANKTRAVYERLAASPQVFFRDLAKEGLVELADYRQMYDIK